MPSVRQDGLTLPEAIDMPWRTLTGVFVGTDFGPGSLTDSGDPPRRPGVERGTR